MSLVYDIYTGKMVDTETHKPIETEEAKKTIEARMQEEHKKKVLADPLSYPVEESLKYIEDPTERFVKALNYIAHDLSAKPTFVDDSDCSFSYEVEWFERFEEMMQKMYQTKDVDKNDPTIKKYRRLYDELKTTYNRINWRQVRFNDRLLAEEEAQTAALREQAYYEKQRYEAQQREYKRQADEDRRAAERMRQEAERRRYNQREAAYNLARRNGKDTYEAQLFRDLF